MKKILIEESRHTTTNEKLLFITTFSNHIKSAEKITANCVKVVLEK